MSRPLADLLAVAEALSRHAESVAEVLGGGPADVEIFGFSEAARIRAVATPEFIAFVEAAEWFVEWKAKGKWEDDVSEGQMVLDQLRATYRAWKASEGK